MKISIDDNGQSPGAGAWSAISGAAAVPEWSRRAGTIDSFTDRGGTADNGKTSFTSAEAAAQITRDGYSQSGYGVVNTAATVTYAFRVSAAEMPEDVSGFSQFNTTQIAAAELALASWADVANVNFVRVGSGAGADAYSNDATLLFGNYDTGAEGAAAFAYFPYEAASDSEDSDVWVNSSLSYNSNPQLGNYGFQALNHEIGHTLGLSHPGDYDASEGDPTYQADAIYFEDSEQYSIMSYWAENVTGANFYTYASAPMMDDIAAAQRLYGANMTTRTGDTVYGANSNADRAWFKSVNGTGNDFVFCVWDAGGTDTFDFSIFTNRSLIDLRAGHFSSTGNQNGNVSIAIGTVIENATGGKGDDLIIGNDAVNRLIGGAGGDTLIGGAGADYIDGTDDFNNTAGYQTAGSGVYVVFGDEAHWTGDAAGDTLLHISNLTGSNFDDTLGGDAGANYLSGGDGNDVIRGGGGNDTMIGGMGNDTYYVDNIGVNITELNYYGAEKDLFDTVYSSVGMFVPTAVEYLYLTGSADLWAAGNENYDDHIYGNNGANALSGNAGNDWLDGAAGNDTLAGGAGDDVLVLDNAGDVATEYENDGTDRIEAAFSYTLTAYLENLTLTGTADLEGKGNALANVISGNSGANALWGYDGDDTLDGAAGADKMNGGAGNDLYVVDNAGDQIFETSGSDTVRASITWTLGAGIENLILAGEALEGFGNDAANSLTGNAGINRLWGNGGDDLLDGGLGADKLAGGAGNDTYLVDNKNDKVYEIVDGIDTGGNDTIRASMTYTLGAGIENLVLAGAAIEGFGNDIANSLTGNAEINKLWGNAGNDILDGGAGDDKLAGGAGDDTYIVDTVGDRTFEIINGVDSGGIDTVWINADHNLEGGYTLGAGVENLVILSYYGRGNGNDGANIITGNQWSNHLWGYGGDDTLDGGTGSDRMAGGAGNDTYIVDNTGDQIYEVIDGVDNGGNDTVRASVTYTLAQRLETLVLTGTAIEGFGNSRANTLTGNESANRLWGKDGNDLLDGAAGADKMAGGAGDDTYVVDHKNDKVYEVLEKIDAGGIDTVHASITYTLGAAVENLVLLGTTVEGFGNELANSLTGNAVANKLWGNGGNDRLDGGLGADKMAGGAGDDLYIVDHKSDKVYEILGGVDSGGNDTVQSSLTYTLGVFVENLTLIGAAYEGFGNDLANTLTGTSLANKLWGNGGNDILDGGAGDDKMAGGAGDDIYYVDHKSDKVYEILNGVDSGGIDEVRASVGFTLGEFIESLSLTGAANINGAGNGLANRLTGNSGNNSLTGGLGADTFVFKAGSGADIVTDFNAAQGDTLDLHAYAGTTAVISQSGASTVIDLGGGNVITLNNVTATDAAFLSHIVW